MRGERGCIFAIPPTERRAFNKDPQPDQKFRRVTNRHDRNAKSQQISRAGIDKLHFVD